MLKAILNLVIPNRCLCGDILIESAADVCQKCWAQIGLISTKSVCETCGNPFEYEALASVKCAECIAQEPHFDKARAVFKYNDINGKMIAGLKYGDQTPYAKTLSKFMASKIKDIGEDFDIIASVPIHRRKLIQRKFNQSALLANRIAKISGKKVDNLVLIKTKNIDPQASLSRKQRIENVKGSIKVNNKYIDNIKDKNILLIDDVITTGATANECAKVLKKAGAAKVYLLTAARTMLES